MKTIALISSILVAASVHATPTKLTLKEAISAGLQYSPSYRQQQSRVRENEASYSKAESSIFPTINGVATADSIKSPGSFSGATFRAGSNSELYKAGATLSQPLYTGGALLAGLSAAKVSQESTSQRLFESKQTTASDIVSAYLNADEARIKVELARANVAILKSYYDITTKYAAIGRSKNIDRLQAQASYELGQSDLLSSENDYEKQLGELQRLTGIELGPEVEFVTKITLQPVETGTLSQLLDKAVKNNPSMKALELDVKYNQELANVRMSIHKPKLSLEGAWGYQSPDRPNWFKDYSNYYSVGLSLTVPIFTGLSSLADRKINAETVSRSQLDLEIFRMQLRQSLDISLSNIKRDFTRLKLAQSAAESSRKAMESAMRDYRQGLLSSTDVLNVQRNRYEAEKQYASAQYSYQRQVLALRQNLGVDLEKTYESIASQ